MHPVPRATADKHGKGGTFPRNPLGLLRTPQLISLPCFVAVFFQHPQFRDLLRRSPRVGAEQARRRDPLEIVEICGPATASSKRKEMGGKGARGGKGVSKGSGAQ